MEDYLGRRKLNLYYFRRLQLLQYRICLMPKFLLLITIKNSSVHAFKQTLIKEQHHSLSSAMNGHWLKIMSKVSKLIMEVISHILWSNYQHLMDHPLNNMEQQTQLKMRERMKKVSKYIIKFLFHLNLFNKDRNLQQSNSLITIMYLTNHQNIKQFLEKLVRGKDKLFSHNPLLVKALLNKTNLFKIYQIQLNFQF